MKRVSRRKGIGPRYASNLTYSSSEDEDDPKEGTSYSTTSNNYSTTPVFEFKVEPQTNDPPAPVPEINIPTPRNKPQNVKAQAPKINIQQTNINNAIFQYQLAQYQLAQYQYAQYQYAQYLRRLNLQWQWEMANRVQKRYMNPYMVRPVMRYQYHPYFRGRGPYLQRYIRQPPILSRPVNPTPAHLPRIRNPAPQVAPQVAPRVAPRTANPRNQSNLYRPYQSVPRKRQPSYPRVTGPIPYKYTQLPYVQPPPKWAGTRMPQPFHSFERSLNPWIPHKTKIGIKHPTWMAYPVENKKRAHDSHLFKVPHVPRYPHENKTVAHQIQSKLYK